MTESTENLRLKAYYQIEVSHWSFLLILFISYFISDQVYSFLDTITPSFINFVDNFTGEYTRVVFICAEMFLLVKLVSIYMPEINISEKPEYWVWIVAIMVLSHPLLIFQNSDGFFVEFEIFNITRRTLDGGDDLFTFIFSSMIYIFTTFGILQILHLTERDDKIENKKLSKLISVDLLPIMGIILIVIYFVQSLAKSSLDEIDYSNPVKIITFIIFAYASMPNITPDTNG